MVEDNGEMDDVMVSGKPLSSLRVIDLKHELTIRGISKTGSKTELSERLAQAIKEHGSDMFTVQKSDDATAEQDARDEPNFTRRTRRFGAQPSSGSGEQTSTTEVETKESLNSEKPISPSIGIASKVAKDNEELLEEMDSEDSSTGSLESKEDQSSSSDTESSSSSGSKSEDSVTSEKESAASIKADASPPIAGLHRKVSEQAEQEEKDKTDVTPGADSAEDSINHEKLDKQAESIKETASRENDECVKNQVEGKKNEAQSNMESEEKLKSTTQAELVQQFSDNTVVVTVGKHEKLDDDEDVEYHTALKRRRKIQFPPTIISNCPNVAKEQTPSHISEKEKPKETSPPPPPPPPKLHRPARKIKFGAKPKDEAIDGEKKSSEIQEDQTVRKRGWSSSSQPSRQTSFTVSSEDLETLVAAQKESKGGGELMEEEEPGEVIDSKEPSVVGTEEEEGLVKESDGEKEEVPVVKKVKLVNEDKENVVKEENNSEGKENEDKKPKPLVIIKTKGKKIQRRLVQVGVRQVAQENGDSGDADKVIRVVATTRKLATIQMDEPIKTKKEASPARCPPSQILSVRGLTRPFTLNMLKMLLGRTGKLVENGGFWIDGIKSHCMVKYESVEDAKASREALHNVTWPSANPKVLRVDFATEEEMDFKLGSPIAKQKREAEEKKRLEEREERHKQRQKELEEKRKKREADREERMKKRRKITESSKDKEKAEKPVREWDRGKIKGQSPPEYKRREPSPKRRRERRSSRDNRRKDSGKGEEVSKKEEAEKQPAKLLDDLFRKTLATPCIYWLPLTEEQAKEHEELKKEKANKRRQMRNDFEREEEDRMGGYRRRRLSRSRSQGRR